MASNQSRSGGGRRNGKLQAGDAARQAVRQIAELTGRSPETVLGLQRGDEGWKVTLELLELNRIPNSTDVLGCYVVSLDDEGELTGYERVGRYQRGQTGSGEQ